MAITMENVRLVVTTAVAEVQAVDLHTHLMPSTHGELLLWGPDSLLTYHYLVAELFMVAPMSLQPDEFYGWSLAKQADLIWAELFVKRSPISEACRGALTCWQRLGLGAELGARDLTAIRAWYSAQDPDEFCQKVMKLAGLRYAVMTNIPFDDGEAKWWDEGAEIPSYFRSALRVDPLFAWAAASEKVAAAGFAKTFEGGKQYLRKWAKKMKPLYVMSSFPADFSYPDAPAAAAGEYSAPAILDNVILPLAEELGLPVALKVGTRRGANAALGQAGDGVGVADVASTMNLARTYPNVKFLVTFLSRVNQHEACVLSRKYRNVHLYGCWWFCNNPSIIDEMSRMRLEMLGTAVTLQHSDARIMDQLVYKWAHSREIIANVLVDKYSDVVRTGWKLTQAEVERDVYLLFGGAAEEFMAK